MIIDKKIKAILSKEVLNSDDIRLLALHLAAINKELGNGTLDKLRYNGAQYKKMCIGIDELGKTLTNK